MIIGVLSLRPERRGGKAHHRKSCRHPLGRQATGVPSGGWEPAGQRPGLVSARDKDTLFPVVGMAKPTLHRDLTEIGVGAFGH